MLIAKLPRYIRKALYCGPKKTITIVYEHLRSILYERLNRKKALQGSAAISWQKFAQYNTITSFYWYFRTLKKKTFYNLDKLYFDEITVITKADILCNKIFNLLGSDEQMFSKIPWHDDFRLKLKKQKMSYSFSKNCFYKDIIINSGKTDALEKDIKLPWELSRFQHLIFLGKAYQKTQAKKYVKAFVDQITDWLDENPYLLGPNWVCPMDVGLRAVNWVICFTYFKNAEIEEQFWQRFVCSLYDHMMYLENNWEIYDSITSNHYLSDLIGYFYLCWFFSGLKNIDEKTMWCYQELLKEFEKQVFDEGTDYESTTNYHKLVTELFYHFYVLAPELGFILPDSFIEKLKRMFNFLDWCTANNGTLIQIGDNDSGKVIAGISSKLVNKMKNEDSSGVKHFPNFGLSLLKTENIHLSLRHHAYQAYQPTGHFHNDIGSITLTLNGIDIFVDPGSYVYTPSSVWRNHFRSVQVHNTFCIKGKEPVAFDQELFYLKMPKNTLKLEKNDQLYTNHTLYAQLGLRAHRQIEYDNQKELIINDWWEKIDNRNQKETLITAWNFTLHPTIILKKNDNSWSLLHQDKHIVEFISDLRFEEIDGFYSPSYGTKIACKRLVACKLLNFKRAIIHLQF